MIPAMRQVTTCEAPSWPSLLLMPSSLAHFLLGLYDRRFVDVPQSCIAGIDDFIRGLRGGTTRATCENSLVPSNVALDERAAV